MTADVPKGLRTAFLSIAILSSIGGCDHPRSTSETEAAAFHEVSQTLVGKRITLAGKFSTRCKPPACVVLENQQVVYLDGLFALTRPYSEMDGKPVEVTGILKYFHDAGPADDTVQREPDHYYFEAESAQLRLISR